MTINGNSATTRGEYQSSGTTAGSAVLVASEPGLATPIRFEGIEPIDLLDMDSIVFEPAEAGQNSTLSVGAHTLTLRSGASIDLPDATWLGGGTIDSDQPLRLTTGASLTGSGLIRSAFIGDATSTITADGDLEIGDATRPDGFATAGELLIGANAVTLADSDQVQLGPERAWANRYLPDR